MAYNRRCAPVALANYVRQVRGVLPDITPHLLRRLLEFLMSAGARSEADIAKMDEHQLADVLGNEDARLLLLYFKMRHLMKVDPASSSAARIVLAFMMMHKIEAEKTRRMLMMMQSTQNQTLDVIVQQMSEMMAMHMGTLDKMSEHIEGQSEIHQETLRAMREQMKTIEKTASSLLCRTQDHPR